jgi:hypothetical protein
MEPRKCNNCGYYAINAQDLSVGECRSTLPNPLTIKDQRGNVKMVGAWPSVKGDFKACGGHRTDQEIETLKLKDISGAVHP